MAARFRIPPGYWRRFAAGAAFGIYMSHLLYYLNPQIEISSTKLTLINLGYGLYCGILFGTILWGLRLLRRRVFPPEEFRPHGFGIMTFATWLTAFVFWGHYLTLRIYLPVPAVRDLKRATITIGVAAFLLLILWLFERTAEKRLSQIIFAIGTSLLLLGGFLLHQRRESYPFTEGETMTTAIQSVQPVRPIVVVEIGPLAHDWLIELQPERSLPFFHEVTEVFFARLEPFPTTSRRSIIASLTTGKLPYRHGVAGQYGWTTPLNQKGEPFLLLPNGVGFRLWGLLPPVSREIAPAPSGHALPVWSIFERVEREARVLSWPGISPGSVEVRGDTKRDLDLLMHAEAILREDPPDLLMVSLDGLRSLAQEHRLDQNVLPPPSTREGQAVRRYLDAIGVALESVHGSLGNGLLIVVSPAAIRPHYRPDDLQSYVRSRLDPHTGDADGFLIVKGEVVRAHRAHAVAAVTDLVPTILFAGGLPVGRDLDGRVLIEAFEPGFVARTPLQLIPSYEVRRLDIRIDDGLAPHQ